MITTTTKINYDLAHKSIAKLEMGTELNSSEKECVLSILQASIGQIVPSKEELKNHRKNQIALENTNPTTAKWSKLLAKVIDFEEKYS